jgi:hypothetical protein
MTTTPHIDDYRIPSSPEVVSRDAAIDLTRPEVGGRLSEAALADALRHALPRHEPDPTAVDRSRIEFGAAAVESSTIGVPSTERPAVLTGPWDLYPYSFYTTDFRRRALAASNEQSNIAA